jgi:hypothetical protein
MSRQRNVVPWWIVIFVAAAVATLLLLGVAAFDALSDRLDRSRERSDIAASQIEELTKGNRMLREQLLDEGIEPSAPPVTLEPVPREEDIVITGERGLSCVEELGFQACQGPRGDQGDKGDPGEGIPGPSCGEEFGFEACRGEPGESIIGPAGADSTVPGPPGPSCVDEFGLEACRGDDGEDSTVPGPAGADGRGIVSVEFVNGGDCHMVITYTEGEPDEFPMPASMCKEPSEEP